VFRENKRREIIEYFTIKLFEEKKKDKQTERDIDRCTNRQKHRPNKSILGERLEKINVEKL